VGVGVGKGVEPVQPVNPEIHTLKPGVSKLPYNPQVVIDSDGFNVQDDVVPEQFVK
jgi:hypothetical protein